MQEDNGVLKDKHIRNQVSADFQGNINISAKVDGHPLKCTSDHTMLIITPVLSFALIFVILFCFTIMIVNRKVTCL